MLAPLAVLFLGMGTVMRRASAAGAQLFFFIFATLIGLSLSSIFIRYTGHSITQTFLVTAIAFAGLSLYGYTTKKDISGWGSFPDYGRHWSSRRDDRKHLPAVARALICDFSNWGVGICRSHRL